MGLENHHIRGSPPGEELGAPAWGSGPTAPGPRGVATGPEGRPRGLPAGALAVGVRPRRGPVTSLCLCTNRWTKRQGRWANHSGHLLVPPPPSGLTAGSAASGSPSRGVGVGGAGRRPPLRAASCAFHKGGNIVAISICFLSQVTSIGGQKCALRAPRCPPSVDAACGRLQLCRARSGALGAGQGSGPGAPPAPGSPGGRVNHRG